MGPLGPESRLAMFFYIALLFPVMDKDAVKEPTCVGRGRHDDGEVEEIGHGRMRDCLLPIESGLVVPHHLVETLLDVNNKEDLDVISSRN